MAARLSTTWRRAISTGSRTAVRLIAAFQAISSRTCPSIDGAGLGRQDQVDRAEAGIERVGEGWRELREAPNARRERITRTVQALLLSVVPVRAVRAPLPASFIAPLVVLRSSRAGPVRGRVSPCPSLVPLPE